MFALETWNPSGTAGQSTYLSGSAESTYQQTNRTTILGGVADAAGTTITATSQTNVTGASTTNETYARDEEKITVSRSGITSYQTNQNNTDLPPEANVNSTSTRSSVVLSSNITGYTDTLIKTTVASSSTTANSGGITTTSGSTVYDTTRSTNRLASSTTAELTVATVRGTSSAAAQYNVPSVSTSEADTTSWTSDNEGKTETYTTTVQVYETVVSYTDGSTLIAGTGTNELTFETTVGSTITSTTFVTAFNNMEKDGYSTEVHAGYGAAYWLGGQLYTLTIQPGTDGLQLFTDLTFVSSGKFRDLYDSAEQSTVVQDYHARILKTQEVHNVTRSEDTDGNASLNGINVTDVANVTKNDTVFDVGGEGTVDTLGNTRESYLLTNWFSSDGWSWTSEITSSFLNTAGRTGLVVPEYYSPNTTTTFYSSLVSITVPIDYQVRETYVSEGATLTRVLGLSTQASTVFGLSEVSTTFETYVGSLHTIIDNYVKVTTAAAGGVGTHIAATEVVSETANLTYVTHLREEPEVKVSNAYNLMMGDRVAYAPWLPDGLAGFCGSYETTYDDIRVYREMTTALLAGEVFTTDQQLSTTDITAKLLRASIHAGAGVTAYCSPQKAYSFSHGTFSIATNQLSGSLVSSITIPATLTSVTTKTHRTGDDTYTAATLALATFAVGMDGRILGDYYANIPIGVVHADTLGKQNTYSVNGQRNLGGAATVYLNEGTAEWSLIGDGESVAAAGGSVQDTHNTCSFTVSNDKAAVIEAASNITVALTRTGGVSDLEFYLSDYKYGS